MDLKYLWRITLTPIVGFENYLIYPDGTVINSKKGNVLTHSLNENGYLYVSLWKNNRANPRTVHRLVAEAFIPNPENKPIVNHKDANRANPHVDNLEWVTIQENKNHAVKNGLMPSGENSKLAKLTKLQVIAIRRLYRMNPTFNREKVREKIGVSSAQISRIIHETRWKNI